MSFPFRFSAFICPGEKKILRKVKIWGKEELLLKTKLEESGQRPEGGQHILISHELKYAEKEAGGGHASLTRGHYRGMEIDVSGEGQGFDYEEESQSILYIPYDRKKTE